MVSLYDDLRELNGVTYNITARSNDNEVDLLTNLEKTGGPFGNIKYWLTVKVSPQYDISSGIKRIRCTCIGFNEADLAIFALRFSHTIRSCFILGKATEQVLLRQPKI